MKIALDCGHGLYTSGKRCLKAIDPKETREWVLNARIGEILEELLTEYDCTVKRLDDVTGKTDIPLGNRVAACNRWGADFLLSIHHNAGINGGSGGGIVAYCAEDARAANREMRDIIYMEVVEATGLKGNRSKPKQAENVSWILWKPECDSVLIECGFMDSTTDTPIILTQAFAQKCAKGLLEGLVAALMLKKKDKSTPSAWAAQLWLRAKNEGITDGSRPGEKITRAETMTMVARAMTEQSFTLATGKAWAKEKGVSDGSRSSKPATREEVITMIYRAMGSVNANLNDAWTWGVKTGVTDGSNRKEHATREMAAVMILRGRALKE